MRRILFVCVGNIARSQMAEAFARHQVTAMGLEVELKSGGTAPGREIHPLTVELMREKGIDVAGARPKPIDLEFAQASDAIISLCGPLDKSCPAPLLPKVTDWGIEDPHEAPMERVREIRDEIERRVLDMLHASEWAGPASPEAPTAAHDTTRLPTETAVHSPARPGLRRKDVSQRPAESE